jgi:RNA polymerase sigma-70 factor (ECF subfamily)
MIFRRKREDPADASSRPAMEVSASLLDDLDRHYRRPLTTYFEKRIRQAYDVDDLVQEVFVRLAYRSRLDDIDSLGAYVFQTAASVIRDRLRRQTTHRAADHDGLDNSPDPADDFSPERVLQSRQRLASAIKALEELPTRTRQVFVLHLYEEMKQEDIAAHLGLSVSGVRFLLRQAKAHLARRVEQDA